jgi:hypothetical protein
MHFVTKIENGRPVGTTSNGNMHTDLDNLVVWCEDASSKAPTLRRLSDVTFEAPNKSKRPRQPCTDVELHKRVQLEWSPREMPPWNYSDFAGYLYHRPADPPKFILIESIDNKGRVFFRVEHPVTRHVVHVMIHKSDIMPETYRLAISTFGNK